MNYIPFVLLFHTKNTLKLTPLDLALDTELFSHFVVTKSTHKGTNKRESINTGLDYWNGGLVEWWTGFFFLVF